MAAVVLERYRLFMQSLVDMTMHAGDTTRANALRRVVESGTWNHDAVQAFLRNVAEVESFEEQPLRPVEAV